MMSKLSDKILNAKTLFWMLVVLGAALRIGSLFGPLSHDELSAIVRLNFDSFSELIDQGVRGDGHPAGVQVMMWLWSRLFGTSALSIRLPFLLMGIASIFLINAVARQWFGEWPALLPTAVLSVTQFTVYYSVIARPYVAGLFLMLCMLYFWSRILLKKEYKLHLLALFALFAALCAYTHYFCLLAALLLGASGLLFLDRRHWWRYLVACAGAVLLFLPHWGITHHQLFALKGVGGWLSKPTPQFLPDHLRYLLHYSWMMMALALVGYGLVFSLKDARQHWKLMAVSLAIWLLSFGIGYLYSVKVSPVLQFSSLIFAFPFLPLALAGAVDSSGRQVRQAVVLLVFVAAMVLTLIFNRKHFQMVQRDYIEITAREMQTAITQYGGDNVTALFNGDIAKLHYYDPSLKCMPHSVMEDYSIFDSTLAATSTPYLICSGLGDPKLVDIVKHHYPYLLRHRDCLVTEVLLFSRKPSQQAIDVEKTALFSQQKNLAPFKGEFCDILDAELSDLSHSRFACFDSHLWFRQSDSVPGSLRMVSEILVDDRCVDYRSVSVSDFRYCHGDTCEISLPVRVETWVKHRSQLSRTRVKVYLWNPDGDTTTIPIRCRTAVYPTNPFIYAVLEEI